MAKSFSFKEDWKIFFMQQAQIMSTRSKDPSTKVGCIIVSQDGYVISEGYNGFPRGIADTEERLNDRTQKYPRIVHGEANAVINACRNGTKIEDGVVFVTQPPCPDCAKMLVQSGISQIYYIDLDKSKKNVAGWRDMLTFSFDMFKEAGIPCQAIPKKYLLTKSQLASIRKKQSAALNR